jgi:hypothetical protein
MNKSWRNSITATPTTTNLFIPNNNVKKVSLSPLTTDSNSFSPSSNTEKLELTAVFGVQTTEELKMLHEEYQQLYTIYKEVNEKVVTLTYITFMFLDFK